MAEQIIAKGNAWDLGDLSDYESYFAEGDKGRLDIKLRTSVPNAVVKGIDSAIRAAGVKLTAPVSQTHSTPTLHICFKKGLAPLAIIAAAVAAGIFVIFLVTAWQISRLPAELAATGVEIAVIVAIIAGAVVLFYYLKSRG